MVCDGFVGNIVLKTCESLAMAMFGMLKRELTANPRDSWAPLLAKNASAPSSGAWTPRVYGGAPLLGFNGAVIKAHGSARERAIANAIRVTTENHPTHVNQIIAREIARANERLPGAHREAALAPHANRRLSMSPLHPPNSKTPAPVTISRAAPAPSPASAPTCPQRS